MVGNCSILHSQSPSLAVDYLITRYGLTRESALKASQKISINSTANADSVLALLNSYGLPKPCISKLIGSCPSLLSRNATVNWVPKIQYFLKMGISRPDLARLFSRNPSVLVNRSLKNHIVPSLEFLKSFFNDGTNIALVLKRLKWGAAFRRLMEPNIKFLRNQGLPEPVILKIILLCPHALSWAQPRFSEAVLKAKEMGCDPSSLMFVHARRALSQLNSTTEVKLEIFRSFGWSEDEIFRMFRKQPYCLRRSEKALRTGLDLFMNKLNLTAAEIIVNPVVLLLSLEKRTIPRYSVIQALLSRGLMKKRSICSALKMNEDRFMEKFVHKYHQELPQLLEEYKCNMVLKDMR